MQQWTVKFMVHNAENSLQSNSTFESENNVVYSLLENKFMRTLYHHNNVRKNYS